MKRTWVLSLGLILGAAELHAQSNCGLTLRVDNARNGQRYNFRWDAVQGADQYVLEESTDNFRTVNRYQFSSTSPREIQLAFQSTVEVRAKYRLTASSSTGAIQPCSTVNEVNYSADASFRKLVQKSVIPLVGSTPGLNGSQFKTSLRLRAQHDEQKGQLVLRRVGIPGTDQDLSIPYQFAKAGDILVWDDIVAAFGVTGLGSLDIIPEDHPHAGMQVPTAEVRLFNVANGGTFGTIEAQTQPFDWRDDIGVRPPLTVHVPGPELRLNMGARAFSASIVIVTTFRNDKAINSAIHTPSTNSIIFMSAADFTGVSDLQPGDRINVQGAGTFVPMYSLTDNRTNDPALFVPPVKVDTNVEHYTIR